MRSFSAHLMHASVMIMALTGAAMPILPSSNFISRQGGGAIFIPKRGKPKRRLKTIKNRRRK